MSRGRSKAARHEATRPLDCRGEGTTDRGRPRGHWKGKSKLCRDSTRKGLRLGKVGWRPDTMGEQTALRAVLVQWVDVGVKPARTMRLERSSGRDCQMLMCPNTASGERNNGGGLSRGKVGTSMFTLEAALRQNKRGGNDIVHEDGSVSPWRDTGFRFTGTTPATVHPQRSAKLGPEIANGSSVHEDDMKFLGAVEGVPVYAVDLDKVQARAMDDIRRNIIAQAKYLADLAAKAAKAAQEGQ